MKVMILVVAIDEMVRIQTVSTIAWYVLGSPLIKRNKRPYRSDPSGPAIPIVLTIV